MEPKQARIVVVGAGQAGASLVAKLRALGHAGPLTLVGDEPDPPYQRPPLSKAYLKGEMALERLFLRPPSFYAAEGITLLTGTARHRHRPRRPHRRPRRRPRAPLRPPRAHHRRPPRRLPRRDAAAISTGVLLMRALADADALAATLAGGARALIVGGGYIGLEAAAVLAREGARRHARSRRRRASSPASRPRPPPTTSATSTAATASLIREGAAPRPPHRRRRASRGAELADRRVLAADLVLVGIGIAPERASPPRPASPSTTASPSTRQGRTSDPAIFAAGDAASFPWQRRRACASKACRTPSTRPRRWPRPCSAARALPTRAVVLVRPVRREAADRRPQRRLGPHRRPPRRAPRQPVGLVLAGRPPASPSTR